MPAVRVLSCGLICTRGRVGSIGGGLTTRLKLGDVAPANETVSGWVPAGAAAVVFMVRVPVLLLITIFAAAAPAGELFKSYGLTVEAVVEKAKELV